jgi:hypothetical protein
MDQYDESGATDVAGMAGRARDAFAAVGGHHHEAGVSVREVAYGGRLIRIETTYKITVDGEPVAGHVMVDVAGHVHYHSIPNQEFDSAVAMVQRVIDLAAPEAGMAGTGGRGGDGHDHGGHGPHHGRG